MQYHWGICFSQCEFERNLLEFGRNFRGIWEKLGELREELGELKNVPTISHCAKIEFLLKRIIAGRSGFVRVLWICVCWLLLALRRRTRWPKSAAHLLMSRCRWQFLDNHATSWRWRKFFTMTIPLPEDSIVSCASPWPFLLQSITIFLEKERNQVKSTKKTRLTFF